MTSSGVNFLQLSGADTFLLFYIKRRIEQDGKLEWIEAPYCCDEDPPREWMVVEEAAILFERGNRCEIEETMVKRLEPIGKLNFRSFRMIVRHYLDLLSQNEKAHLAILALIAFTGIYARRLAELDIAQEDHGQLDWRNFRREIYQVSIYASRILLTQLDGKWESFCTEIMALMEEDGPEFDSSKSPHSITLSAGYPQLCGLGLPLMAICGFGAAAFLWLRRCQAA